MILKGNQRAGGMQLAVHLMNTRDNDHVTLHDIRGFIADDLSGAFKEAFAISRGTRCKQFLFSLSLSPPETENVPVAVFDNAIEAIEEKLGLSGQPRAVVFHEKDGRRHAHCVWSRIDIETMTAINLPHYKLKLRDVSRQLYIEHGWSMPKGLMNSQEGNPLNFSREEWQQAKRIGRDPRTIKAIFQDCWATSDGLRTFQNALEARGYYLASGKRGFVAVDWQGEVFAVSKWTDQRAKDVRAKLGDPSALQSVEDVSAYVAKLVDQKLEKFSAEMRQQFEKARTGLAEKRAALVQRQRTERQELKERQAVRQMQENQTRADRFRKGLLGLWDWVTGRRATTREQNEAELAECLKRDQDQQQKLIERHLAERRELQLQMKRLRDRHELDRNSLGSAKSPLGQDRLVKSDDDSSPRLEKGKQLRLNP